MTEPVVLGFGGCVDYEVTLTSAVLDDLIETYQIRAADIALAPAVLTERDLVISILAHMRQGEGGEHFVASPAALLSFSGRMPSRITLGGTSVRAGIIMARLGVPSTLHLVTVNRYFQELLPPTCSSIGGEGIDTLYPHLIVQYDRDLRVQASDIDIETPFPNRLIYVNDPANEMLPLSPRIGALLVDAEMLLISGFNAIRDPAVLEQRLVTLRQHLVHLNPRAFVYYEDAAFHVPAFNRRVRDALIDVIDVFGFNEDELQGHLGRSVDLLSVSDVEAALTAMQARIPVPTLVLHTKYWALALGQRADEYADALDAAIVMASTRYSHGDEFSDDDHEAMRHQPRREDACRFAAELEARMPNVRCVAGLRLEVTRPTTVGLGDTFVGGFLAASQKRTVRCS